MARTTVWQRLSHRWGWRLYALPALLLATVLVVVVPSGPGAATPTRGPAAADATRGSGVDAGLERLSAPQAFTATMTTADTAACATNPAGQLLLVSIGAQHAWACDGSTTVLSTPVTTGADVPDRETHLGSWHVQAKTTDTTLTGPGYSEHVDYWVPYDGDFGLHDATWQTFAFGGSQWTTDGSHGCVHLPLTAMAWTYQWAQVGSTTITIEA